MMDHVKGCAAGPEVEAGSFEYLNRYSTSSKLHKDIIENLKF